MRWIAIHQISIAHWRARAGRNIHLMPLILRLSKDVHCHRRMVRQARHERVKGDFGKALAFEQNL